MTDGGADHSSPPGVVQRLDFESAALGQRPSEFVSVLGDWIVSSDGRQRVLKQRGSFESDDFPRIVVKDVAFGNVHAKVRCSMQDGDEDRACGLMFRFKNSDNYYLARANVLEDNVALYAVVGGEQRQLSTKNIQLSSGPWHVLETFAEGTSIRVVWDGKEVLSFEDGSFTRGKVGLWTKADSITLFDELEATELQPLFE